MRLVYRYPNHPSAQGKAPWSGKAWGPVKEAGRVVQAEETEPRALVDWEVVPVSEREAIWLAGVSAEAEQASTEGWATTKKEKAARAPAKDNGSTRVGYDYTRLAEEAAVNAEQMKQAQQLAAEAEGAAAQVGWEGDMEGSSQEKVVAVQGPVAAEFAVKAAAEQEGLDEVFRAAGFEWRNAGCSMCLAMNPDRLEGRQVCASSSNRNFKGRQGSPTGRTLLMSPAMVAAAAVAGEVVDVRKALSPMRGKP